MNQALEVAGRRNERSCRGRLHRRLQRLFPHGMDQRAVASRNTFDFPKMIVLKNRMIGIAAARIVISLYIRACLADEVAN